MNVCFIIELFYYRTSINVCQEKIWLEFKFGERKDAKAQVIEQASLRTCEPAKDRKNVNTKNR